MELVRRLARADGRQTQYASVTLDVDDQWRGRLSRQVEIVVDMVGIYVRGLAAGATFTEALDELDRKLERRLGYARDQVRSRTGRRPVPEQAGRKALSNQLASGSTWTCGTAGRCAPEGGARQ